MCFQDVINEIILRQSVLNVLYLIDVVFISRLCDLAEELLNIFHKTKTFAKTF